MLTNVQNSYSFKKIYKKKIKNIKFNKITIGIVGLRACESGRLCPKQLETIRRVVVRTTKRTGKFWLRIFVDQPLVKKPKSSRMGKGSGSLHLWVVDVKVGQIIMEISTLTIKLIKKIYKNVSLRLPLKSELVLKKINYDKN